MTPTTTRLSADERRDAIVAAAMTEFAVTGYAGTSTEAIARRSGVSQPYLFQLFGTKKDLFIAAVRHGFGRTTRPSRPPAGLPALEDPSTEHVLDAMGHAYCDLLRDRELLLLPAPGLRRLRRPRDPARRRRGVDAHVPPGRATCPAPTTHELEHWFAKGMLMNTAAAIGPEMAETGVFSFAELGRIAAIR